MTEAYWAEVARAHTSDRSGSVIALWRSTADARPANGGHGDPVSIGHIDKTDGPLSLCHAGTLHATFRPDKWQGERLWVVALHGEVAIGDYKLGALKREILAEVK